MVLILNFQPPALSNMFGDSGLELDQVLILGFSPSTASSNSVLFRSEQNVVGVDYKIILKNTNTEETPDITAHLES